MVRRITVFKIIAKTIIVFCAAAMLFWLVGLYNFYRSIPMTMNSAPEKADAIIVLTGGQDRIAEGVKLLNSKVAPLMLISGVGKATEMNQLLQKQKLPPEQIKILDHSKIAVGRKAINTVGNARETADWVAQNNVKSIILVTSNYHMPRSMVEFKKHIPGVAITPHPVFTPEFTRDNWRDSEQTRKLILIEYMKYLMASIGK